MVFTAMFLFNAFLVSKTFVKIPTYFSYRRILDGVAISYCWNLVVIPSLVWNHYDTYNILSQIALLISSIHTFRGKSCSWYIIVVKYILHSLAVCVDPSYFLSISSTLCCFAMRQSTSHFLRQHLIDSWMPSQPNENVQLQFASKLLRFRSSTLKFPLIFPINNPFIFITHDIIPMWFTKFSSDVFLTILFN